MHTCMDLCSEIYLPEDTEQSECDGISVSVYAGFLDMTSAENKLLSTLGTYLDYVEWLSVWIGITI